MFLAVVNAMYPWKKKKKKKKTGSRWSPEFFSDFLRNYINWLHNCEDCSLLDWNVNHFKCKPLICFSVRTKKSFDRLISDTLPTAFFYRLVMFLPVSERTITKKKKKGKLKMLFSWFTILFMARFMDLWWNKRQISEIKYWNIFSVFVSIHYVTWSIVTPQKTDRILITVKRVLLFSNQKKLQFDKGYY